METCIISYSMTGNNDKLAKVMATALEADHIVVNELKKRSNFTIVFDNLLGRTPKVSPSSNVIDGYEKIIFVGPIWMEMPPSPLRTYFKAVKKNNKSYSFVTISGGSLNKNPRLIKNLKKTAGHNLEVLKDMYISDLLDQDKPTPKETGDYVLTENNIKTLAEDVIKSL